jgi:stage V sporulation protein G
VITREEQPVKITEVRIFPRREDGDKKLRAFAALTFDDCFVVRDIKVIEGGNGLFVAMPSRKTKAPCQKCGYRNASHSHYCNQCGSKLELEHAQVEQSPEDATAARHSAHKDIAHPITVECREYIQKAILEAYQNKGKEQTA